MNARAADQFAAEKLIIDPTGTLPLATVWDLWRTWAVTHGHPTGVRRDAVSVLVDRLQLRREHRNGVTRLVGIRLRTDRDTANGVLGGARPWR